MLMSTQLKRRHELQQDNQLRGQDIEKQDPQKAKVNSEEKGKTKESWIGKKLHPGGRFLKIWNVIFVVSCMIAILVDPLFFYLPVVNEEKKCLALDTTLMIIAFCLRAVTDMIYLVHIILQFLRPYIDKIQRELGETGLVTDARKIAKRYLIRGYLVLDILAILPVSQVVVPFIFSEMRGSTSLNRRKLLNAIVLFQYVPSITRMYFAWRKVNEATALFKSPILVARASFNLFLYIVGSHVLGAFWFFYSIQRHTACWHIACDNHIGCNPHFGNCDHGFGNYTFLNDYCSVKTPNKTFFYDGIFLEALQSDTVSSTSFMRKIMYSFSSFGGNLQTSQNFWENWFAVLISIFGLVLFLFFIGNVQMYMQLETSKQLETYMDEEDLAKKSGKESSIKLWMKRNKLPENQRKVLISGMQGKLRKKKDIDTENLFPHLPILLRMVIKKHLCLPILKEVPILKNEDEALLKWICMYLKPVYYKEHKYIFREGEPIDMMLFITQGIVLKFPTSISVETNDYIEKGNFYGEQLLESGLTSLNLSELPISTATLRTHTKVEAFGLMANDLKTLLSLLKNKQIPSTAEASLTIQKAWRAFLKNRPQAKLECVCVLRCV